MERVKEFFYECDQILIEPLGQMYDYAIPNDIGYIYLIWAKGTRMFKLGYSVDPNRRLKQLSSTPTKMPYELELILTWHTPTMALSEKSVHAALESKRQRGEWFCLDGEDLAWLFCPSAENVIGAALYRHLLSYWENSGDFLDEAWRRFPDMSPESLGARSIGIIHAALADMGDLAQGCGFGALDKKLRQELEDAMTNRLWGAVS